jgi:hypothetical protein
MKQIYLTEIYVDDGPPIKCQDWYSYFHEVAKLDEKLKMLDAASGKELDSIGELYGIKRLELDQLIASDEVYRKQILDFICGPGPQTISPKELSEHFDPHVGHEVIENYAGGKAFKYCRNCKIEVP